MGQDWIKELTQWENDPKRTMKYPYTFTAQVRQFPYKFYFNNLWIFRYYCYALIPTMGVFWWIQGKARSPENTKKWNDIHAHEKKERHWHKYNYVH